MRQTFGEMTSEVRAVKNSAQNLTDAVWAIEGILKPGIVYERIQAKFIGAAGGNFSSSPEQVKEAISLHSSIIIAPDAGDVINKSVMKRWQRQIEFFQREGKSVFIAWWGQITKEQEEDLDELPEEKLDSLSYISPSEFLEIAKKEQYKKQCWDRWKDTKKFTPQFKINQQFFECELPQKNTITYIKSGLGTGKTTKVKSWLIKELKKYGAVSLGYRNTLLLQFCGDKEERSKLGFTHVHEYSKEERILLKDPQGRIVLCVDSILKLDPQDFDEKILIIDELISVIKHLLFSPTIRKRREVIDRFRQAIIRADRVIALDGLMTDWAVNFLRKIAPNKQIITVENIYKSNTSVIHWLESSIAIARKTGAISRLKNDRSPWLDRLLKSSILPAVCSDNQTFLEALEQSLIEQGRKGLRIDSKTVALQFS